MVDVLGSVRDWIGYPGHELEPALGTPVLL